MHALLWVQRGLIYRVPGHRFHSRKIHKRRTYQVRTRTRYHTKYHASCTRTRYHIKYHASCKYRTYKTPKYVPYVAVGCAHLPVSDALAAEYNSTCSSMQYRTPTAIIRNWKAGPGWVSYLRTGVFYLKFSTITTLEFLMFLRISACLSYCSCSYYILRSRL